ncbi:MAG: DUF91 domain-containing protein [Anaerotignum sp.]|nr:DUF91 domain-containing protein [Anaerotignum sp.]
MFLDEGGGIVVKREVDVMTYKDAEKYYFENFMGMELREVSKELDKLNIEGIDLLRNVFCNDVLYTISGGFIRYGENFFEDNELVDIYKTHVEKLPKELDLYWAVYYYFSNDNVKAMQMMKKAMQFCFADKVREEDIIDCIWEPFKQGYNGFWDEICNEIQKYDLAEGVFEFCCLINDFYAAKTNEEIVDKISLFIQKYPDFVSPREVLGLTYHNMKMWRNSLACLEAIEEPLLYGMYKDHIYFQMAWAYGKCKELKREEEYYRKCLEVELYSLNAMNNLAYCLYQQKKYLEAKELLEKCLEEKRDLPFSANNYIRVLIALGRNGDAKRFIKDNSEYKIIKSLKDKVAKLDNKNARLKKVDVIDGAEEIWEEDAVFTSGENDKFNIKREQFSSEKILEDELTARLEAGLPTFGKNLKVYRRHGVYGRQYIIPIGRLDLLCEDERGDLYIIELKKDAGYDDAYAQTAMYLDWFEKDEISKGKKVYGIICLNSPTKELIDKVHADKRMQIFEYQISYREL